ncbi:MAG: adenylate/guanylate cyclase domain-containing protein, partial [Pseudomonadota bacterium]
AVAIGLVYAWLALTPGLSADDLGLVNLWSGCALFLAYAIAPIVYYYYCRPLWEAGLSLLEKRKIAPPLLLKARQRALNLPVMLTRISTNVWMLSALSFIPVYAIFRPEKPIHTAIHVVVCVILVSSASFSFIYYSTEWFSQRYVIPVLFPEGHLSRVNGVEQVTTRFKILVLVVTTCAMPVVVLCLSALLGVTSPALYVFLGSTFVALGLLQGVVIARSLTGPMGQVVREMARVRDGDLSAKAQVLSVDNVGALTEGFNEMVSGLRRAERVRDTFGRYVSREVMEKVLEGVDLGGELRQATVLFSAIRNFTTLTETLPPHQLLSSLNGYLDVMVDAVVDSGGRVDKFVGDSVMAVFGVPLDQEDHAQRAVITGLEMLKRLEKWNAEMAGQGFRPWEIGIGVHTGEVIAGNIGSAKKMEYAVIGDVVNTASRIEQMNKTFGTHLLISQQTYEQVADMVLAEKQDTVVPKGKTQPVTLYNVLGLKT